MNNTWAANIDIDISTIEILRDCTNIDALHHMFTGMLQGVFIYLLDNIQTTIVDLLRI